MKLNSITQRNMTQIAVSLSIDNPQYADTIRDINWGLLPERSCKGASRLNSFQMII